MKTVTFDTNTFGMLNPNDERVGNEQRIVGDAIRQEISKGNIRGYISDASLFVECLEFADKLAYLAVAGTPDPRPTVDSRGFEAVQELLKLDIAMLHAPLIGGEIFIEDMPWAEDEHYSVEKRQNRFSALGRKFGHPQKTIEPLRLIGNELLQKQPPVPQNLSWPTENGVKFEIRQKWAVGLKRAWEDADENTKKSLRKQINPIIGEWCDILIVSSHYAYGNDIFCTNDKGKGAGTSSILHHSNRENLESEGIKVVLPKDLLGYL